MSKTLQSTVDWARPLCKFDPLLLAVDNGEPILTNANIVLQTMLSAPFCWPWNRAFTSSPFSLSQDLAVSIADFGFAERCAVTGTDGTFEIEVKGSLSADGNIGQPQFFSVLTDDGAGALVLRFQPKPTAATYTGVLVYQKIAPTIAAFSDTWTPVPDRYAFIYQQGFLARSLFSANDPRAQDEGRKFMACLLGACEGLSEEDKNIFAEHWLMTQNQGTADNLKTQQGVGSRSL